MKKFLLLNLTIIFCATPLSGQTYRYIGVSKVDENEIRHKLEGSFYITFTNNKQIMYLSDENGNVAYGGKFTYKLKNKSDGMLTYFFIYPEDPRKSGNNSPYAVGSYVGTMEGIKNSKIDETTYTFSSDYSRLNYKWYDTSANKFYILVYEKQREAQAPTIMY